MKLPRKKREETSATVVQTLWLVLACCALCGLTAYAAAPAWWSSPGTGSQSAVVTPQVTTNNGVVSTNYVPNDYAVVTQGQLKQFTARAVDELNTNLPGGAGTNLNSLVSTWASDYATNGYNATNIKPSDYTAMNVGQLKYIGNKVWAPLVAAGYTNAAPAWLQQNTNTDNIVATLGQLKEVFNFDLAFDSDNNGLPDWWEIKYFGQIGNDPTATDSATGLTYGQDYLYGLIPGSGTIDSNGIPYAWEVLYFNRIGIDPTIMDSSTGLSYGQEYQYGVTPGSGPTDGNGLPYAWEMEYFGQVEINPDATDPNGLTNWESYQNGLDPTATNTMDSNDISYAWEEQYFGQIGVTPSTMDSSTGLTYGQDYNYGVTPGSGPTDWNGLPYTWEIQYFNEIDIDPSATDPNGLTNLESYENSLDPTATGTMDGNDLSYTWEVQYFGHISLTASTTDSTTGLTYLEEYNDGVNPGSGLTDSNVLPYAWEMQYFGRIGVDPTTTGNNGITYLQSYQFGLDPNSSETMDSNDISYAWEIQYFNRIEINPDDVDPNGLTNLESYELGFDPTATGTMDSNEISYAWEEQYFGQIGITPSTIDSSTGLTYLQEYQNSVVPDSGPTDSNGISYAWEVQYYGQTGLNPTTVDSSTGVAYGQEYQYGVIPGSGTTDIYGILPYAWEIQYYAQIGLNPWTIDSSTGVSYLDEYYQHVIPGSGLMDSNGLPYAWESSFLINFGTNPNTIDSTNGLTYLQDYEFGLEPNFSGPIDYDPLTYTWEVQYFGRIEIDPNSVDSSTGLSYGQEFQDGVVPGSGPMDDNGLPYAWEMEYFNQIGVDSTTIGSNGITYLQSYQYGLAPNSSSIDSAYNVLPYAWEVQYIGQIGLNPGTSDPTNSPTGLTYGQEYQYSVIPGSGPIDSAYGVLSYVWEIQYLGQIGINPTPTDSSTGLTYGQEYTNGVNPGSGTIDPAYGVFSYAWEVQYFGAININPNDDPDGDGYSNIYEYTHGTDPTSASSVPTPDFVVDAAGSTAYTTIQSAIDALTSDYQIIAVMPGTYQENLSSTNYKVMLRSTNGATSTIIDPQQTGSAIVLGQDSIIDDFTVIHSSGPAVDVEPDQDGASTNVSMVNCVLYGNQSTGGILYANASNVTVTNCTLLNNTLNSGSYAVETDNGTATLVNTILWDGGSEIGVDSTVTATYSDIEGATVYAGQGNINANPLFWVGNDGHIIAGSPCIDAGTSVGAPNRDMDNEARPSGNGYDIGADEYIDSDGNGLPDWWQLQYFGQLGNDPASSPDDNGYTLLEDYQGSADPTNYYIQPGTSGPVTITPALTIINGNNQTFYLGAFTPQPLIVNVTNSNDGAALVNAPVTFTVTQGGGQLAISTTSATQSTIQLNTDSSGQAQVYYQQPSTGNVTSTITATTASQSVSFTEISEVPTAAKPTFSPDGGIFSTSQTVTVSSAATSLVPTNVALASNGATASASSVYGGGGNYPASSAITGNRAGLNWGYYGGWNDGTFYDYPDWLEVDFSGSQTISEIDVFTEQDVYYAPSDPTLDMTFSLYGITDFDVQYWNGSVWVDVPNGSVTGNNNVWRQFAFSPIATAKIRVLVNNSDYGYSRITDLEAWSVPLSSATIYYTTDGTTPTSTSTLYTGPFTLTQDATVNSAVFLDNVQISAIATIPFYLDSDNNGLPDSWEIRYFGHIGNDPNAPDPNGLTNLESYQLGLDPTATGTVDSSNGMTYEQEYEYGIIPGSGTTDSNGLPYAWEIQYFGAVGLDPTTMDSSTGVAYGQEYQYHVVPGSGTTESTGISYAWEIQYFGQIGIDPNADPDGDGYSNIYESTHGTDPTSASSVPTPDFVVDPSGISSPYTTIQSAIDNLTSDDQIIAVMPGTYQENLSSTSYKVMLRSSNGAAVTIIDAQQTGSAIILGKDSIIDDFTIIHSSGPAVDVEPGSDGSSTNVTMVNCVLYDNQSDSGILYANASNLTATNCTLFSNTLSSGSYAIETNNGAAVLVNTILWDGGNEIDSPVTATYSDIQGATVHAGQGNLNSNPLLTSDGHLMHGSPCFGEGTSVGAPNRDMDNEARPAGSRYDIGADEYIDTDGQGLPDWWQWQYFGQLGNDPSAMDGNGLTNLQSYQYSLDPTATNPIDSNGISYVWELQNYNQIRLDPYGDPTGSGYPNIYKYTHNVSTTGTPTPDFVVDAAGSTAYPTIQSAINATTGDYQIISVMPGTYTESPSIYYHKLLVRSTNGAASTIINPQQQDIGAQSWTDSIIDNFTFTNAIIAGFFTEDSATVRLVNCVFCGNQVDDGVLVAWSANFIATNCTIFNNTLASGCFAVQTEGGTVTLTNTILWDGGNEIGLDSSTGQTTVTAAYCDIQGTSTYPGIGNINSNPLLWPDGHVGVGSPVIGAATGAGAPARDMDNEPRPYSGGYDIGADQYVDSQGTGIADWWQEKYFNHLGVSLTALSPNGDQRSNLWNYQQRGDPNNPLDTNGISSAWEVQNYNQLGIDPYGDPTGSGYPNIYKYAHNVSATGTPTPDFVVDTAGSTAYATIQSAIDATTSDYQIILVMPGTYMENLYVSNYKILIRSINGAASTTIDAQQGWGASVYQDSIIDDFTITNAGYAGIYATDNATARLVNCLFYGNQVSDGILYAYSGNLIATNCTLFNNTGVFAVRPAGGTVTLTNTILWDGGNEIGVDEYSGLSATTATYCDIQGTSTYPGIGNINSNPLLWPDGHLGVGSPAIGAATGIGAPDRDMDNESRPYGGGYDIGADQYVDSQGTGMADWWQEKYFDGLIDSSTVTPNGTAGEDYQYHIDPVSTNTIDSNGISYVWEIQYFGHIGIDPNATDPNGLTNLESYQNGLDPTATGTMDSNGFSYVNEVAFFGQVHIDLNNYDSSTGLTYGQDYQYGVKSGSGLFDSNGISYAWEIQYFGQIMIDPAADPSGDGTSNYMSFILGLNPVAPAPSSVDTDGDGVPDYLDYYPNDPTRWLNLPNDPNDHTPPTIELDVPSYATLVN